jgi:hypothetical protein
MLNWLQGRDYILEGNGRPEFNINAIFLNNSDKHKLQNNLFGLTDKSCMIYIPEQVPFAQFVLQKQRVIGVEKFLGQSKIQN